MSHERPYQSTRQGDPTEYQLPNAPDHAPDYTEQIDDFSEAPDRQRVRRILTGVGATAATLSLAAGIFVGDKWLGHNDTASAKEGQRPAATALANPETSPSTAATAEVDPNDPRHWTPDTTPITLDTNGDGTAETYTGPEQLAAALQIDVTKYPKPEDAMRAIVARFNEVVSWGTDEASRQKYDRFVSVDHQRVGVGAAKQDVVLPAFEQAVIGEPTTDAAGDITESPQNWFDWMNEMAYAANSRWLMTREQEHPYEYNCKVDDSTGYGVVIPGGNSKQKLWSGIVRVACRDNIDQTDLGKRQLADGTTGHNSLDSDQKWTMIVQQQGDTWKLVGMQTW